MCVEPGSVIGISTSVRGDVTGFEARVGARNFSHHQNLQIGSETSQALTLTGHFPVVKLSEVNH